MVLCSIEKPSNEYQRPLFYSPRFSKNKKSNLSVNSQEMEKRPPFTCSGCYSFQELCAKTHSSPKFLSSEQTVLFYKSTRNFLYRIVIYQELEGSCSPFLSIQVPYENEADGVLGHQRQGFNEKLQQKLTQLCAWWAKQHRECRQTSTKTRIIFIYLFLLPKRYQRLLFYSPRLLKIKCLIFQ